MPPRLASPRRPPRAGFTLVELMVATLILSVGVLGLASTSVAVTRLLRGSARQSRAAYAALARFDSLRALRCAALPAAAQTGAAPGGLVERWRVSPDAASAAFPSAGRVVDVLDSVSYREPDGTRYQVYRTAVECLP